MVKLCVVCINGRRYVCCSDCNVVSISSSLLAYLPYSLNPDGYSERADDAAQLSLEAETVAREASDTITDIVDQLPEDRARVDQISVDILRVNADILRAQESGG